jgi:archaeal flagellar protein FlaF
MESVITGVLIITLLLLTVLTVTHSYLSTQDALYRSWRDMESRLGERAHTSLTPVRAQTSGGGGTVEVTLRNDGQTKLADFAHWDMIVKYDTGTQSLIEQLPYGSGVNQWAPTAILAGDGLAEVLDPGILNPDEQIVLRVLLSPAVGLGTRNAVTVVTPNGISASAVFTN